MHLSPLLTRRCLHLWQPPLDFGRHRLGFCFFFCGEGNPSVLAILLKVKILRILVFRGREKHQSEMAGVSGENPIKAF